MNVFVVYAHPEPNSFNGALKNVAVETLTAAGHNVAVSDLYAMAFNPVAGRGDIIGEPTNPEFFSLATEQTSAFDSGRTAPDIAAEMQKLKDADLVIFQFPIWWFGMPAILKGWADRVFARGFAYIGGRKYDTGMFKGKLAMISTTTGTSMDTYAPDGVDGDILTVLWPLHNGLFRYSGFEVLPPFVAYMPARVGETGRRDYLEAFRKRLTELDTTPRLFFHPNEDFGPNERLRPGILARSGVQRNV